MLVDVYSYVQNKHQGPREEVIVCIFTSFSGGIGRDGE